jgi:excisionase family DNA binding protein
MIEPWISVERVAEHLDVTRDSIYRWIEAKGFPSRKLSMLSRQ